MKYLQENYEISPGNILNISMKHMKYLKKTHHICQGNSPYM